MWGAGSSPHNLTLVQCVRALLSFYLLMGSAPFDRDAATDVAYHYLVLLKSLAKESKRNGDKIWTVKPKHHLFAELAFYQIYDEGNPVDFWCYMDEAFCGLIGESAFLKGGARNAQTLPRNVFSKWRSLVGQ